MGRLKRMFALIAQLFAQRGQIFQWLALGAATFPRGKTQYFKAIGAMYKKQSQATYDKRSANIINDDAINCPVHSGKKWGFSRAVCGGTGPPVHIITISGQHTVAHREVHGLWVAINTPCWRSKK